MLVITRSRRSDRGVPFNLCPELSAPSLAVSTGSPVRQGGCQKLRERRPLINYQDARLSHSHGEYLYCLRCWLRLRPQCSQPCKGKIMRKCIVFPGSRSTSMRPPSHYDFPRGQQSESFLAALGGEKVVKTLAFTSHPCRSRCPEPSKSSIGDLAECVVLLYRRFSAHNRRMMPLTPDWSSKFRSLWERACGFHYFASLKGQIHTCRTRCRGTVPRCSS
jgi:hypothetical protein